MTYIDVGVNGKPNLVLVDGDNEMAAQFTKPNRQQQFAELGGVRIYSEGPPSSTEEFLDRVGDARVIFFGWPVPSDVIDKLGSGRMLAYLGTGVDNFLDLAQTRAQELTVTNTPAYGAAAVAEHAIALSLSTLRDISQLDRSLRDGAWVPSTGQQLHGSTVGIIGLGAIGTHAAKLFQAFGARVLVWTRRDGEARAAEHGFEHADLETIFREADVISLHLTLNDETRNMFGSELLRKMRSGAVLVNTARAELLNPEDLKSAVQAGSIRYATDVFHEEPAGPESEYLFSSAVTVTPHVGYATDGAISNMADIAIRNAVAYLNGEPQNIIA